MMQQLAHDFRDESEALFALLARQDIAVLDRPTLFKGWTPCDAISHLHAWNITADMALNAPADFVLHRERVIAHVASGGRLLEFDLKLLGGLRGRELLETWRAFYTAMSERFAVVEPKLRLQWVGPEMSARSSITARLMETWAHAQAVYDMLGAMRTDTDRIRNVAQIGVNTFGWSFINRGLPVPAAAPHVRLESPSGAIWEWNSPESTDRISGLASEFCQVVTQVRNVADTQLEVSGDTARHWMSIAQCFAGGPEDPPAPDTRRTAQTRQA
jgi:uncharacterized protein (TIGR03084 family)